MHSVKTGWVVVIVSAMGGLLPARAAAQTKYQPQISVATGWSRLWDDETMLGGGVPLGGGIGWLVADRLLLSADGEWFRHTRDAGYLIAKGDAWTGLGRATWLFGRPTSRVRATAGGGLGVMRSTGTLTIRSFFPGPLGMPVPGPDTSAPWRVTGAMFEVNGGVRMRVAERVALRPEMRWRWSAGGSRHSGIEPPFLTIGAVVRAEIDLR
jgi:hypothetical protein